MLNKLLTTPDLLEQSLMLPEQQLVALGLVRLSSKGCPVPSVNTARARWNRQRILVDLCRFYQAHPCCVEAIILVCNAYPEALWWLDHSKGAGDLIAERTAQLLKLRARGGDEGQEDARRTGP